MRALFLPPPLSFLPPSNTSFFSLLPFHPSFSASQTFLYSYFIFSKRSISRVNFIKSVSTYRETAKIKRAVTGSHQKPMAGKGVN